MTRTLHILRAEFHCQLWQQLRVPLQFVSVTFGGILGYLGWILVAEFFRFPVDMDAWGEWIIVFFGTFNTFNLGLMQVGYTTANERSMGWMRLKRASPMRPLVYFASKLVVSLLQAMLFALALLTLVVLFGHWQMSPSQAATLFAMLTLGVLPFCALGLALAYLGGPNTARVVTSYASLALVGLAVLSLGEFDLGLAGTVLQVVNQLFPVYHFAVLAFGFTGLPALQGGPAWLHALALVGLTVLFTTLAIYLYRRDEGKTYG